MDRMEDLLDRAIEAALSAGREILAVYGSAFAVEHKDDRSPLTEADRRAHKVIAAILTGTGLPVLSEEGAEVPVPERQQWQRYWLVDPLDGTKEFVKRNGEFTVNIALMERADGADGATGASRPIAGILYVPVKDILYFAWEGGGAYRQKDAATSRPVSPYQRATMAERLPISQQRTGFTVVASRSHRSAETEAFISSMEEQHGSVAITSMGSALKICLVAEGVADVYPRYAPTMEWDTAAGHAICLEAGTDILDLTTNASMRYNKNELVNNWFIVQ